MKGPRGIRLEVGAFYTTTDPKVPIVRVISTRVKELNKDMLETGPSRGYWLQVVDGTYHAPFATDMFGCWRYDTGITYMIRDKVASAVKKYIEA